MRTGRLLRIKYSSNIKDSQVDTRARTWTCPFCLQRNQLPPHYKDISPEQVPSEIMPANTTVEYRLARPAPAPPIFLFVVDTCQDEESLKSLTESLIESLTLLPPYALVGLITYGTMVWRISDKRCCRKIANSCNRYKFMSLDTLSAPNHLFSVVQRTTLQSKCKK